MGFGGRDAPLWSRMVCVRMNAWVRVCVIEPTCFPACTGRIICACLHKWVCGFVWVCFCVHGPLFPCVCVSVFICVCAWVCVSVCACVWEMIGGLTEGPAFLGLLCKTWLHWSTKQSRTESVLLISSADQGSLPSHIITLESEARIC